MRKLSYRPAALADIRALLKTSRRIFGARAMADYQALLKRAAAMLCEKPSRAGVKHRADLNLAPFVFHLRHARRKSGSPKEPRHLIVFTFNDASVTILRVLHESMDIPAQVATEE